MFAFGKRRPSWRNRAVVSHAPDRFVTHEVILNVGGPPPPVGRAQLYAQPRHRVILSIGLVQINGQVNIFGCHELCRPLSTSHS